MKKNIFRALCASFAIALTSCEAPLLNDTSADNITLTFTPTTTDMTRATNAANYFTKLNVQLFDHNGDKVFDKVKTQLSTDDDFCTMSLNLASGIYTIIAVGHSSTKSATIKSPESVQFTATDGEKLTDTFCHCSQIAVGSSAADYTIPMYRVGAMIQFILTDETVPTNFSHFLIEYTGGSANFNPTTLEGTTKSAQSERRIRNSLNIHQAYTFPYMATSCTLNMTCTALASDGSSIRTRHFDAVPVTRNRITTYTGNFFTDGDGTFTQSDFGFVIHTDWDGEITYDF